MRDQAARGQCGQGTQVGLIHRGPVHPAPDAPQYVRPSTGNSSHFRSALVRTPIATARMQGQTRYESNRRPQKRRSGDEVNLISYLPTAITTLFALAAGLLLGYIQ